MSDLFGELRSLLQQPPSPALWYELQAFFDATREAEASTRAVHIEYALGHVLQWPARWCPLETDHFVPQLAQTLALDHHNATCAEMWLCDADIRHIEVLSLGNLRWTTQHQGWLDIAPFRHALRRVEVLEVRAKFGLERFWAALPSHLEELQLWGVPMTSASWDGFLELMTRIPLTRLEVHEAPNPEVLLDACDPARLTHLHLTGARASHVVSALLQRDAWPALRTLDLRGSDVTHADTKRLSQHTQLPNLTSLWLGEGSVQTNTLDAWPTLRELHLDAPNSAQTSSLAKRDIALR